MILGIGNDHAGVELKESVIRHLTQNGHEVIDYGAKEGEKSDYPVPARRVAEAIVAGEVEKGILICGSGIGIGISANKVPGVRCAICSEPYSAQMSVAHNDCNCIAFGARVVGEGEALLIMDAFLSASFEGERHARRVSMITDIENAYGIAIGEDEDT